MKEVPLTRGLVCIVDDDDFALVSQRKWCANKSDGRSYAMSWDGAAKKFVYMHRIICAAPKGMVVDHINGDTLDNRRSNLRVVTTSQNAMNSVSHRDSASRFKGVAVNSKPGTKDPKPWVAHICIDGKTRHLGCFRTEEEASLAYEQAARGAHGEFGRFSNA